jgi:hypothetical protein
VPSPTEDPVQLAGAAIFAIALAHTFLTRQLERLASRLPRHAGLFHLLGEVEIVFGFWAIVFVAFVAIARGHDTAIAYVETRNYTEPLFVFVVMVIAASRPIVAGVVAAIALIARGVPLPRQLVQVWLGLAIVPLLGSLITEPAAMTIAALLLAPTAFHPELPERAKYFALGVLFVNVSIGGTLSAYAAPPVLMVASAWQWDSAFMLSRFGWRAALAVIVNATLATAMLRTHLRPMPPSERGAAPAIPLPVVLAHVALLAGVVALAHHPVAFVGMFLLFLGFAQAYERYQDPLVLREALLVGFFLSGLVVLGGAQSWWLKPIVSGLEPLALFFSALGLTAIVDNAALTYLGSLVPGISEAAKTMLVAGAVAGGGLTVIANAPNPAGTALLRRGFADEAIGAGALLLGALAPTAIAAAAFLL